MRANDGVLAVRLHPRATNNLLLRRGAIVRVFPGVFVDADLLTDRHTRYAAALAARPAAVLWGDSAVAVIRSDCTLFGPREVIQLAQPIESQGVGLSVSRRVIDPADVRLYNGLRCPRAALVAVEAAARDNGRTAELALREGLARPHELTAALEVFKGTRGQAVRQSVIVSFADNPWSGGERHLQLLLRSEGVDGWLANPRINLPGGACYPDLLFADQRLVVEFDGFAVHSSAEAFEADRRRQNRLVLAGFRVLRYTWRRLQDDPQGLIVEIRAALAAYEPVIA